MAQADGVVSNGSGVAVREDINNQLAALFTNHSGPTSPSTTFAYQTWADTTAGQLKLRNGADSAWIALRGLSNGEFVTPDGSAATPSLNFAADTNTGFYRYGDDSIGFATNGTHRMLIGGTIVTDEAGPSLLWKTTVHTAMAM